MATVNEIINKANKKIEEQKRLKRAAVRRERETKKVKDNRRNYIIGKIFVKYFPEVLSLEPGTKAENVVEFSAIDILFLRLAKNETANIWLQEEITQKASLSNSQDQK